MTSRVRDAEPAQSSRRGPVYAVSLMVILTFVTGLVDAVGFLGLDRVFVGNMTGNVVILGMGAAGADDLPVAGPFAALVAFTLAAAGAGFVLRRQGTSWTSITTTLLAVGSAVLLILAALFAIPRFADSAHFEILAACATAGVMGVQACVARKLAIRDMTTVVVTSTLTQLSADLFTGGWRGWWNRRSAAILALFAGAVVGAVLLRYAHMSWAMGLAAVLTAAVCIQGHRRLRPRPTV
ncbi:DUF1275 domain-containing protein [Gordonia terrae]|uniref:DUF1275 domain-containing protein n=1 Tax=Gordonia terrae TaxID=2055 RepID=A0AAD0KBC9_9ACTN|nr:YoaK family protein [Gordonia sp. LAM0048]ANY25582.1 hypothetical protein BCM27_24710 [Gordonia terrae]AWO86326.1 DUF1275 domain-containing protein [Gordonia terrae]VTR08538.1 Predicted membrane protein [Clostridioides difficile]VTS64000.1 Predicted membrane protein [Gordonia terrae]